MLMLLLNKMKNYKTNNAFTIIELLVVIVVLAILATLTITSFVGVTDKARKAGLQADLSSNSKTLKLYQAQYGSYPTSLNSSNCPTAPVADNAYCLKTGSGNSITAYVGGQTTFTLKESSSSTNNYAITESSAPVVSNSCPIGFIAVPGSSTYGTSDFCVMKYEPKVDTDGDGFGDTSQATAWNTWPNNTHPVGSSGRTLVSSASGYPIAMINQTEASAAASATAGCTGCHLITEAERMTIIQNVLSVASNWSGGSVGSGYIYSGHNDAAPNYALVASTNDSLGYFGATNTGGNQRRTLTLTNGEVIWDFAGNVNEMTTGQQTGGQPSPTGSAIREWTAVSGGSFAVNPYPSGTGISGASGWTSTNGIGKIWSDGSSTATRLFVRGGAWGDTVNAGVLNLFLDGYTPADRYAGLSFRVTK